MSSFGFTVALANEDLEFLGMKNEPSDVACRTLQEEDQHSLLGKLSFREASPPFQIYLLRNQIYLLRNLLIEKSY